MAFEQAHAVIAEELADVELMISRQLKRVCDDDPLLEALFQAWARKRGKRLRPRLTILSASVLRGSNLRASQDAAMRAQLLTLAAIVELVHSASLIHDDVLDRASTRRGIATLNSRFGNKVAVLAGDILYSQVFEMLLGAIAPERARALIRCVRGMCRAEVVGVSYRDCTAYEAIIAGKTASLMQYCCAAGAETVRWPGDSPALVAALDSFGQSYGMVYQLVDDLCDGDVDEAIVPRDWLVMRAEAYGCAAWRALEAVPESPYRDGLAAMLEVVMVEHRKAIAGTHPVSAGQGVGQPA